MNAFRRISAVIYARFHEGRGKVRGIRYALEFEERA